MTKVYTLLVEALDRLRVSDVLQTMQFSVGSDHMSGNELVPSLMFMTLGVGLLVGVCALIWFLRKRSNRDAYKRATGIDEDAGKR